MLAVLGGIAGWLFAALLLKLVIAASPAGLPRVNQVTLDFTALAFHVGRCRAHFALSSGSHPPGNLREFNRCKRCAIQRSTPPPARVG